MSNPPNLADTPVDFIQNWLLVQPKLNLPPSWRGGWERWAQGQIALFMEGNNGYQVWTEENIYRDFPKEACDLEFRKGAVRKFCELKCYGATSEESAKTFVNRVVVDYDQVQKVLVPAAKGSTLWVVAVSQFGFRNALMNERNTNPKWAQFGLQTVNTIGTVNSQMSFDIWYFPFVNNK